MVRHFLVTRFSLIIGEWPTTFRADKSARNRWFRYREAMFRKTLFSSLLFQTCPFEKVYLLLDSGDVALFESHFDTYPKWITPIFASGTGQDHHRIVAERIKSTTSGLVVISRCDSDDILHQDYSAAVCSVVRQKLHEHIQSGYVVASRGYITDGRSIQSVLYNTAPFIAHYSPTSLLDDIFSFEHDSIADKKPALLLPPLWIQVYHGGNVANRTLKPFSTFVSRSGICLSAGPLQPIKSHWPEGFIYYTSSRWRTISSRLNKALHRIIPALPGLSLFTFTRR